jgi:hypothetical protein
MSTNARQHVYAAVERITVSQLVDGTAFKIFSKIPNGAIPLVGFIAIVTPFASASADSLTVGKALSGTAASANGYLTASDLQAAAGTRYALTGLPAVVNDTDGGIQPTITWTATGTDSVVGELRAVLTFVMDGAEHFSEG